jgi:hypothetical protein
MGIERAAGGRDGVGWSLDWRLTLHRCGMVMIQGEIR